MCLVNCININCNEKENKNNSNDCNGENNKVAQYNDKVELIKRMSKDFRLRSITNKRYPNKLNQIKKQYGNVRKSWASSRALNQGQNSREARSTGRERNKNNNQQINNGYNTNYGPKIKIITNRHEHTIVPDTSSIPFPSELEKEFDMNQLNERKTLK